ncbi:hypothetical protein TREES_T100021769 [Tupaia chinensis]|uniref:Uncharacterized protein n=1 Tax=Tupaia chinensis TaxID=246437 RepID=L9JK91_TUPCH|nr:hypothetical protein TREES_T100021769 [Tupaia chinensis]
MHSGHGAVASHVEARAAHVNPSATSSVGSDRSTGSIRLGSAALGPQLLEEEHKCRLQGPPTSVLKTQMTVSRQSSALGPRPCTRGAVPLRRASAGGRAGSRRLRSPGRGVNARRPRRASKSAASASLSHSGRGHQAEVAVPARPYAFLPAGERKSAKRN